MLHSMNMVLNLGGPLLSPRLYAPQQKASFLDFSADENGLWTIMGLAVDNNTVVTKWGIDEDNVQPQYMWNISLSHHQVGFPCSITLAKWDCPFYSYYHSGFNFFAP